MGASLLRAYEEWAEERADEVRMGFLINMRPAATGRVLGKMGYMGLEMIMVKQ